MSLQPDNIMGILKNDPGGLSEILQDADF